MTYGMGNFGQPDTFFKADNTVLAFEESSGQHGGMFFKMHYANATSPTDATDPTASTSPYELMSYGNAAQHAVKFLFKDTCSTNA